MYCALSSCLYSVCGMYSTYACTYTYICMYTHLHLHLQLHLQVLHAYVHVGVSVVWMYVCCGCGCVSVSDCYPFSPSLPLRACRKLTGPSSGTLSLTKSHEVSQLCIAADHKLTVMVYVCMLLSVWLNCWPSQIANQCAYVICRHGYFLLL